ncbi:hypothetical protein R3P38DRAFT_3219065 [Favolaschia claudopus]|uniref:Uncharacterized protein n=1 Tax=Favolaschia claudopus TaxID=2862362 RepID=A0AAW0A2X6_9AGAR
MDTGTGSTRGFVPGVWRVRVRVSTSQTRSIPCTRAGRPAFTDAAQPAPTLETAETRETATWNDSRHRKRVENGPSSDLMSVLGCPGDAESSAAYPRVTRAGLRVGSSTGTVLAGRGVLRLVATLSDLLGTVFCLHYLFPNILRCSFVLAASLRLQAFFFQAFLIDVEADLAPAIRLDFSLGAYIVAEIHQLSDKDVRSIISATQSVLEGSDNSVWDTFPWSVAHPTRIRDLHPDPSLEVTAIWLFIPPSWSYILRSCPPTPDLLNVLRSNEEHIASFINDKSLALVGEKLSNPYHHWHNILKWLQAERTYISGLISPPPVSQTSFFLRQYIHPPVLSPQAPTHTPPAPSPSPLPLSLHLLFPIPLHLHLPLHLHRTVPSSLFLIRSSTLPPLLLLRPPSTTSSFIPPSPDKLPPHTVPAVTS